LKNAILIFLATLIGSTVHAQDQIDAFSRYMDCVTPKVNAFTNYIDSLAVFYPRFGLAWCDQKQGLSAVKPDNRDASKATTDIHERFKSDQVELVAEKSH